MKVVTRLLVVMVLIVGYVTTPVCAGDTDPLFVNLTTEEPHRATMGLVFGKNQFDRGHPLTIFLNDKAVFIGSTAHATKFVEQQKMLTELLAKGATVLICPLCMQHYGVKEADRLPSIKMGNPELTGGALFKDNTKTMTW